MLFFPLPTQVTSDSEAEDSWLFGAVHDSLADAIAGLPSPGSTIDGKYRIDELVGRGGMGAVYRATQLLSDRPVALKWMLRAGDHECARLRFLREARVIGRVVHPNVVTLYDVCATPEACYLVMELLRGQSLRSHLANGPLSCRDTLELLLPAMRGVAAAHRVGVIHRDLKPDNVFVSDTVKVLDFGVSSIADAEATLTQAGAVLGSPAYMSPEQLEDPHTVDARTDVYSFGVILYEALAGKRPFERNRVSDLLNPRFVAALSRARPDLSPGLSEIVMSCLEQRVTDRPSSVNELIAMLEPFVRE